MDLVVFLSVLAGLFVVVGLAQPLSELVRLPFAVVLALLGIMIGAGAGFFLATDLTDALNPLALSILGLPISSQVFLYVFLPTLLFQVALTLDLRRMLDDWVPILVMAVLAVVVATFVIGAALMPVAAQPLVVCLMAGAIVATTDPSAVVAIFREIGAPARLARLIEGESLLNDAAAIALFGLFLALVVPGLEEPSLPWLAFVMTLAGGALTGIAIAAGIVALADWLRGQPLAQVSVSVALPYIAFITAERAVGASGVIAVVAAGMTLNLAGPARLPPDQWKYLRDTWDLLAHWAGSLVFLLAALLVPRLLDGLTWRDAGIVGVTVTAAFAARALILFGLLPLMRMARVSPEISPAYKAVILWGGLRGAVTLALALAVSENPRVAPDAQRLVVVVATGFTLFTLLVQGTTLRAMIRLTGIDRPPPLEAALQSQVVAVALQTVRAVVAEVAGRYALTRETVRSEAKRFAERLDRAVAHAEEGTEILDRDRLTLGLVTLAGREREMVLDGFREGTIPAALMTRMLAAADRLIEGTRIVGRSAYRQAARDALAYGRGHALATFLHRRLRLSRPLARRVADRFETLIITRMILRDLHDFVDSRILRIHGRRVADILHEVLTRREEETEREIAGMRLQYPGFAEEIERRFIRRTALRLEEREIAASRDDGLIGADLYAALMRDVNARRRGVEARPRLDLERQKDEMVAAFPLFASLSEVARRRLARGLQTVYADPGELVVRKGTTAGAVYFVASGALELEIAGQRQPLGPDEMFGELALLTGSRVRRGNVRAITHATLLRLDESRFFALLRRWPELRSEVVENATRRGLDRSAVERVLADRLAGR
ncbi:MAG: cation:proton antiporter [Rhodobacteraceae bacterium]|jgi:CPA1 family monovalent cation:H+ antiporter|nr:cation:proton antiporter [Paracoccaceae bacterium]